MIAVRARIKQLAVDEAFVVPIVVPDLSDVRRFANDLHSKRQVWKGEAFGWDAEYNPQVSEPPPDSRMTFTAADFCMGESGVWFFSMMWEDGQESEPVEFLDESGIAAAADAA